MIAFVFPGQGAQFEGMGQQIMDKGEKGKALLERSNDILGIDIAKVMIEGSADDLMHTSITQPAIFIHSMAVWDAKESVDEKIGGFAGHSLGEFSALVAAGSIDFDAGLRLIAERAQAMQDACTMQKGSMSAVIGLDDEVVEEVCDGIEGVVAANYNSPGQIVISGSIEALDEADKILTEKGARKVVRLAVGGAFHSPLMKPAEERLAKIIETTVVKTPEAPIYCNVNARATTDPQEIKQNLLVQLTAPVRWTQSVVQMISDGMTQAYEVGGRGGVLAGLNKRIDRKFKTEVL